MAMFDFLSKTRSAITVTLLTVLCLPLLPVQAAPSASQGWRPLFDGKSLAGWTTYLAKPHASVQIPGEPRNTKGEYVAPIGEHRDPTQVFTVVTLEGEKVIRISGEIFGAITTTESFSNYRLRLEMRWGEKKWEPRLKLRRDSGLLYHAHGPQGAEGAWMKSIETQIQEHDCGDLWTVGAQATARSVPMGEKDRVYDANGEPFVFGIPKQLRRCIKEADYEKPHGQWNEIEVVCFGDRSWHLVNGKVVLRLTDLRSRLDGVLAPLQEGQIQIQSEGAELYVRKVEILPLGTLPAEFAD